MAEAKIRTCIACGRTSNTSDLVRFVRQADGRVALDPTGKMAGRGAYVCATPECLDAARKRKGLDRALRVKLDADTYARLSDEFKTLCLGHIEQ